MTDKTVQQRPLAAGRQRRRTQAILFLVGAMTMMATFAVASYLTAQFAAAAAS